MGTSSPTSSPASVACSCRRWLCSSGLAIVASACSGGSGGADLKGKQLVFASLGGSYQDAEVQAFIEPFMKETGAEVTSLEEFEGLDLAYAPPFAPVRDPLLIAARQLTKLIN